MSKRVLLADTDVVLLEKYREFLLQEGFDVMVARDALDCVAKLRSFVPDVLVLAPELPWGQSEGVLAMMYEEPDVPLVPVVVLSAAEDPEGRCGVGFFPASAYHIKPLAPSRLALSVRRLLRTNLSGAESQEVLQ
jgi:DNA-binding response OmpR family regulator